MERHSRPRRAAGVALVGALSVLLLLPVLSTAGPVEDIEQNVQKTLDPVTQTIDRVLPPAQRGQPAKRKGAPASRPAQPAQTPGQGGYVPPLHGAGPHGQGTVAVIDVQPNDTRPLEGDPTGASDPGQAREEVIVGRARGEENNGNYRGHVTIVSLFGNEVLGVDTGPGESASGPLDAIQQGILDQLCAGTGDNICLEVLRADSTTTPTSSTNRFAVANASVGGAQGVNANAAESSGTISEDANCQTATGDSRVAGASIGGQAVASVATASSTSQSCTGGTQSQTVDGHVLQLFGTAVPLPDPGCGEGTANTAFTPLAPLLSIVCNATDVNGTQTNDPYGVREALSVFAIEAGGTSLVKTTTAAAESHAEAPAGPPVTPEDRPECSDGVDNDGDGRVDFPADPGCTSAEDDSEADRRDRRDPREDEPECSDGRDNDGDGEVDFPADPQCSSPEDDSEGGGPGDGDGRPECDDGIDNDGDGEVDFPADPECASAQDDSEGPDVAGATARGGGNLPVTGVELLLIALLGSVALGGGLALRRMVDRSEGPASA